MSAAKRGGGGLENLTKAGTNIRGKGGQVIKLHQHVSEFLKHADVIRGCDGGGECGYS